MSRQGHSAFSCMYSTYTYVQNKHKILLIFLEFVKLVVGILSGYLFPNPWTTAVKKELTILTSSILEKLRTNMLT